VTNVAVAGDGRIYDAKFVSLTLTNFLSYKSASMEFGNFTALVGPNGSGKSNVIAAVKLLRDIPLHGLPNAIARRGGFDQLRHRSMGRPYDPAIRIDFRLNNQTKTSYYELKLGSVVGGRYVVKRERGSIYLDGENDFHFDQTNGRLTWRDRIAGQLAHTSDSQGLPVPPGQSAIPLSAGFASYLIAEVLQGTQTLELNPTRIGEWQEPSSVRVLESDGSNVASILEEMSQQERNELVELLAAVVPGIVNISVRHVADKVTVVFTQDVGQGPREFFAKQMSDGTLRVFGILVAVTQGVGGNLLAVEEPEVAIHLGALQTLVQILQAQTDSTQILITTHSADIVDQLDLDDLRVVWSEDGASKIAPVADHTREPVRQGLITPGSLLRADALDPSA